MLVIMDELSELSPEKLKELISQAIAYLNEDFSVLKKVRHSERAAFTALVEYFRKKGGLHSSEYLRELEDENWAPSVKSVLLESLREKDSEYGRRQRPQSLQDFTWKIDVALSTNSLSKVLRPEIQLSFETSEEEIDFHMTVEQFQDLRRQTAVVVKDVFHLDQFAFVRNLK